MQHKHTQIVVFAKLNKPGVELNFFKKTENTAVKQCKKAKQKSYLFLSISYKYKRRHSEIIRIVRQLILSSTA